MTIPLALKGALEFHKGHQSRWTDQLKKWEDPKGWGGNAKKQTIKKPQTSQVFETL